MAFGNSVDSQEVERALARVGACSDPLALISKLRRELPDELAREAALLHELRLRLAKSDLDPTLQFLNRKGLQQATAAPVAAFRAHRVKDLAPDSLIWDCTCGVGADSLAFTQAGLKVLSSDRDGPTLAHAACNLHANRQPTNCVQADALHPPLAPGAGTRIVLVDPDRRPRVEGMHAREGHTEHWAPPLATAVALAFTHRGGCIKLPPAMQLEHLPDLKGRPHQFQWISLAGQVRELALWTGLLAPGPLGQREAVVLSRKARPAAFSGVPEEVPPLSPDEANEIQWMAEPDPAIICAGLVGPLARRWGMRPLGPKLAFLGGSSCPDSPFLRAWRVKGVSSTDPKRVRTLLARHDIGPLTVKKRGHPDDASTLAKRFRGPGRVHGLLAVARLETGHLALLLEPTPAKR